MKLLKPKISFFFLLILIFVSNYVFSQAVVINEIMSLNYSTLHDNDSNFCDWIEIYNDDTIAINLKSYHLSDDNNELYKWTFPEIIIEAKGFLLLMASGNDINDGKYFHTNFKISSSGENIYFSDSSGNLLTVAPKIELKADQSYGREVDGKNNFLIFDISSPGSSNSDNDIFSKIQFSRSSGFYKEAISVEITTNNPNDTIYYTLNGNKPTQNSKVYTKPLTIKSRKDEEAIYSLIRTNPPETNKKFVWKQPEGSINKATVLRVCTFKNAKRLSKVITQSYFIGSEKPDYTFAVISLVTDSSNLFDYYSGIYIPGYLNDLNPGEWESGNYYGRGKEWEREVDFEMFDKNGSSVFKQKAGMRMQGSASRIMPQKSFRLYAEKEYGNETFNHNFFGYKNIDVFKRIMLRNSGHDFLRTMFADAIMQYLIRNFKAEYMAWKPSVVFVNGEYWGIHNIRERYDKYFLSDFHQLHEDSIDFLDTRMRILVIEGDSMHYHNLIEFLHNYDISKKNNYDYVKTQMDIENYIDFQIAKIYSATYDFPGNNVKMWRPRSSNGKWRWLNIDNDDCLRAVGANSLKHATRDTGTQWPNPAWSTFLFRKLLENNEFQQKFINRFAYLLNTTFNPDTVLNTVLQFKELYGKEIQEHIYRWNYPADYIEWENNVEKFIEFAQQRPCNLREFIMNFFELDEFGFKCIESPNNENELITFPNPSSGTFNIHLKNIVDAEFNFSVIDLFGKIIYSGNFNIDKYHHQYRINLGHLNSGIYILHSKYNDKSYFSKIIISGK
ncbi:MAG: CotH kinase family protein [Bacteroidota bacterium]|nr:CotH kinase family protein [Bacteroidota bacterium]